MVLRTWYVVVAQSARRVLRRDAELKSSTAAQREAARLAFAVRRPVQRWLVLAGLVWRIAGVLVVIPAAWIWLQFEPMLLAAIFVAVAGNITLLLVLARNADVIIRLDSLPMLVLDVGLALGLNLLASSLIPQGTLYGMGQYRDFFSPYLWGTVIIWTGIRGRVTGLVVAFVAAVPLQIGMAWLNDYPLDTTPIAFVDRNGWLLVSYVLAVSALLFATRAATATARESDRAGREAERARMLADMHDTVIQTLEGIALQASTDDHAPARDKLEHLAAIAKEQADELRLVLRLDQERNGQVFARALQEVALESRRRYGLRVTITSMDISSEPAGNSADGIIGATREALTNVAKHAHCNEATVEASSDKAQVTVIVSDSGRGYDTAATTKGYGVSESVEERMRNLGGWARSDSKPGEGTRVTLWAPN